MSEKKLFLGRSKPMADVRGMLELWQAGGESLPHVALIWGQGGIGKTTIVLHIHSEIIDEIDAAGPRATVDWDKYFPRRRIMTERLLFRLTMS